MKCIYMLKFPSNKVYIGKADDWDIRWKQHKKPTLKQYQYILYRAMFKYGWKNIRTQILERFKEDVSEEFMFEREKYFIAKYNSFEKGYNMTRGGPGRHWDNNGKKSHSMKMKEYHASLSKEEKEKIAKSRSKKMKKYHASLTDEQKQKMYSHLYMSSAERSKKMKKYYASLSEEEKKILAKKKKQYQLSLSKEERKKQVTRQGQRMEVTASKDNKTYTFASLKECTRELSKRTGKLLDRKEIRKCARGLRNEYHGFTFKLTGN